MWSAGGDSPSPVSAQTLFEADRPAVTSDPVDGYMVLAPSVLRSGQTESISVSLFSGQHPARGTVRLALFDPETPFGRRLREVSKVREQSHSRCRISPGDTIN